jgi:hypothetical protein
MFFLGAVTRQELDVDRAAISRNTGLLGFVPTGTDGDGETPGYYILCPILRFRWGRYGERWEEPYRAFADLAARAGAHLPLAARQLVPYAPADPASWWLAYMWWSNPPTEDDLRAPDGVDRNARVIWAEPFLDAATVIETSGLLVPQTPQTSQTPKKTAGKKPVKRHRRPRNIPTNRQLDAYAIYLRVKTFEATGAELGISKEAARKLVRKAEKLTNTTARSAWAQQLPTDSRGQVMIPDDRETDNRRKRFDDEDEVEGEFDDGFDDDDS